MTDDSQLTPAQENVLRYIADYIRSNGAPPTQREIADAMGYSHQSGVQGHLAALHKKGFITRLNPEVRSFRDIKIIKTPSHFPQYGASPVSA